jgi:eukaryotic-like serine/threonine-protein kinase
LNRRIRDELDWIAMKAMEKERDRRYQTANEFADDILRYLKDGEVHARPPSTAYRLQKLFKRHRAVFGWIAAMFVVLSIALAGTTKAYLWARVEMARSDAAFRRSEVAGTLRFTSTSQLRDYRERSLELRDQLLNELVQESQRHSSEMTAIRRRVLEATADFLLRSIDVEKNGAGDATNAAVDDYHMRIALCFARLGDHRRANQHAAHLSRTATITPSWALDLLRIYALAAKAAESDPKLAGEYRDKAMEALRLASDDARDKPPDIADPELATIADHRDFKNLLKQWRANRPAADPKLNAPPPKP